MVSSPPSSGPLTAPSPAVMPNAASALIRSAAGKVTCMTDRTCGIISAPMAPWATREAISIPALCAAPHSADMIVKPTTPVRNRRLRP